MKRSISFLALAASLYLVTPQRAQEPHIELVRGLRDKNYPDLALEYLTELAKRKDLPADVKLLLPLETARTQVEMAKNLSDLGRRTGLFTQARQHMEAFLKANPTSPLVAEVKLDLARIVGAAAKAQFSKARELSGEARRAAMLGARAQFADAGKSLTEAETGIADLAAKDAKNQKLAQAKLDAEYEKAVNLLDQLLTYEGDKEVKERNAIAAQVKNALDKVYRENDKNPTGWMARAWMMRYLDETDNFLEAVTEFKNFSAKTPGPYVEPGRRMARAFYVQMMARKDPTSKEGITEIIKHGREWVLDYRTFLATPEGNAVRFALAQAIQNHADKDPKSKEAADYYAAAEKLFDDLEQVENEFSERARTHKTEILLKRKPELLQGEIDKLQNFRECYVRAQLEIAQLARLEKEGADAGKKTKHRRNILEALERGLDIADETNTSIQDKIDARYMLIYYLMVTGRRYEAAVQGEDLARNYPNSTRAGDAGGYALYAYAQIMDAEKEGAAEATKQTDLARVRALATYIETNWKNEVAADAARHQLGLLALNEKNYAAAIDALSRVSPAYSLYPNVQAELARTAQQAQKDKIPPIKGKPDWQEMAAGIYEKMTEPKTFDADSNRTYFYSKFQLLQIFFQKKKYDEMDKLVTSLRTRFDQLQKKKVAGLDELADPLLTLGYYAVYGKADTLYNSAAKDRFTQVRKLVDPVVDQLGAEMTKLTTIKIERAKLEAQLQQIPDKKDAKIEKQLQDLDGKEKEVLPIDAGLYRALIGLDLKSNVLDGQTDRAKKILDLLQRSAGDFENQGLILVDLVQQFTRQIKELEKQGDKAKADKDKMESQLAAFLDELAKQPLDKMKPEILRFLAYSYSGLAKHDQAAKLLDKVPEPPAGTKPEDMKFYYTVRLMLSRELRLSKKLEEAAKIQDQLKKTDFGTKSLDLRKEEIHLLEDKGLYGAAANAWNKLIAELKKLVDRGGNPQAKDHYNECFFRYVYCMYKFGSNNKDETKKKDYIKRAARLIVTLEQTDQMGNMKEKYQELIENEAPLKAECDVMRKDAAPKAGAAAANP